MTAAFSSTVFYNAVVTVKHVLIRQKTVYFNKLLKNC